ASLMRKSILILSALSIPALFTGCVGTGPNTERGAISGGTLGAIAGGIIGNNSRGGDTFGGGVLGATAGALAGGLIGNSVDQERGTFYDQPYPAARGYRRAVAVPQSLPPPPPAPAESIGPAPSADAVWVPGYWLYDGRGYRWNTGH